MFVISLLVPIDPRQEACILFPPPPAMFACYSTGLCVFLFFACIKSLVEGLAACKKREAMMAEKALLDAALTATVEADRHYEREEKRRQEADRLLKEQSNQLLLLGDNAERIFSLEERKKMADSLRATQRALAAESVRQQLSHTSSPIASHASEPSDMRLRSLEVPDLDAEEVEATGSTEPSSLLLPEAPASRSHHTTRVTFASNERSSSSSSSSSTSTRALSGPPTGSAAAIPRATTATVATTTTTATQAASAHAHSAASTGQTGRPGSAVVSVHDVASSSAKTAAPPGGSSIYVPASTTGSSTLSLAVANASESTKSTTPAVILHSLTASASISATRTAPLLEVVTAPEPDDVFPADDDDDDGLINDAASIASDAADPGGEEWNERAAFDDDYQEDCMEEDETVIGFDFGYNYGHLLQPEDTRFALSSLATLPTFADDSASSASKRAQEKAAETRRRMRIGKSLGMVGVLHSSVVKNSHMSVMGDLEELREEDEEQQEEDAEEEEEEEEEEDEDEEEDDEEEEEGDDEEDHDEDDENGHDKEGGGSSACDTSGRGSRPDSSGTF